MRVAVTGNSGQVVCALRERANPVHHQIIPLGRPLFDLAEPQTILSAISACEPDVVVSAAAYTAVDKAESEQDIAFAINAKGAGRVAAAAAELDIPVIQISTDYVFDGQSQTAYLETDVASPLSVYGATKLAGERAVASVTANHVILRTAWVYSPFGRNFAKTMLNVASKNTELRVVSDQIGSPTSALDIADVILKVADNLIDSPNSMDLRGIFHMTATGTASWAEFAEWIFSCSKNVGGPFADVERISTAQYPTAAPRPLNSRLDCHKLASKHGCVLPEWQSSAQKVVERLIGSAA